MELRYKQVGDYLYPSLPCRNRQFTESVSMAICIWSTSKKHRRGTYSHLLMSGRLNEYLHSIDELARKTVNEMVARLAAERGVNEALKAENALLWVQEMNNCKSAAEEIVLHEVIYQGKQGIDPELEAALAFGCRKARSVYSQRRVGADRKNDFPGQFYL